MEPDRKTAEQALKEAYQSNPGVWVDHSRYVALACENIARRCADLDSGKISRKVGRADCGNDFSNTL